MKYLFNNLSCEISISNAAFSELLRIGAFKTILIDNDDYQNRELFKNKYCEVHKCKIGENLINFLNYNIFDNNLIFKLFLNLFDTIQEASVDNDFWYAHEYSASDIFNIQKEIKEYVDFAVNDFSYFDIDFINCLCEHGIFQKPEFISHSYIEGLKVYQTANFDISDYKHLFDLNKSKHNKKITYTCNTFESCMTAELLEICRNKYIIKKCENCGKYFIPYFRSDTIYCENISPQDETRTCKEYGTQKLWYEKLKNNEAMKLCRNIHSSKQMLAKRRTDRPEYQKNFEEFKINSQQWKNDIRAGIKTEEEFIEWLKIAKEKRY